MLSIDYQDEFIITAEIRENEKDNPNASLIYHGSGNSINDALENISLSINKVLYLVDLNTVIITENIIKNKMNNTLDYLTRASNIGYNFRLIVSNEKIDDIIKIIKDKNKIVGSYLRDTITNTNNNTINIKYNDLLINYLSKYQDTIFPYCTIENDNISLKNAIMLNKDKELVFLNNDDVVIYNLLNNDLNNGIFPINYENKDIVYRIKSIKNKIEYKDKIIINIDLVGNFNEIENINLNKETINKIKKKVKNNIKNKISKTLDKTIENNIDVFGLKKIIYNKQKIDIESINKIDYEININIKIEREELIFNALGENNEI